MNERIPQLLSAIETALTELAQHLLDLYRGTAKDVIMSNAIRSGVPIPSDSKGYKRTTRYDYPIGNLKIGESFDLEGSDANLKLHNASMRLRATGSRFAIRSRYDSNGKRCGATIWLIG